MSLVKKEAGFAGILGKIVLVEWSVMICGDRSITEAAESHGRESGMV